LGAEIFRESKKHNIHTAVTTYRLLKASKTARKTKQNIKDHNQHDFVAQGLKVVSPAKHMGDIRVNHDTMLILSKRVHHQKNIVSC